MISGHLRARGIRVQRARIRALLREMDPLQSARRWGFLTQRRAYSVPGANYLWHIDGHHALIRFRLVTHGGIDGFSRLIVYLSCSNNNRAETVHVLFSRATEAYGYPERVRADRGGENVLVQAAMEERNPRGFIAGRSVHNSRIERLWRDVFYSVIQTFYSLFYYLENHGLLDVDSDKDLFCLHLVYLPVINRTLDEFKQAYNNHPLRTERNFSPLQLWHNDLERRRQLALPVPDPSIHVEDLAVYGIDPDIGPAVTDQDYHTVVEVPPTMVQLTPEQTQQLQVESQRESEFYIDTFLSVKQSMCQFL